MDFGNIFSAFLRLLLILVVGACLSLQDKLVVGLVVSADILGGIGGSSVFTRLELGASLTN